MEEWQKNLIEENIVELIKRTTFDTLLLVHFRKNKILTQQDIELIDLPDWPSHKKIMKLYDLLVSRVGAFDVLLRALEETNQTGALDLLKGRTPFSPNNGSIQFDNKRLPGTGSVGTQVFKGTESTTVTIATSDMANGQPGCISEKSKNNALKNITKVEQTCQVGEANTISTPELSSRVHFPEHHPAPEPFSETQGFSVESATGFHRKQYTSRNATDGVEEEARECFTTKNLKEISDALMEVDAPKHAATYDDATPLTPTAIRERSYEKLKYIIQRGGDVNCKDEDGNSILHYVVEHGNTENIKCFIEMDADIHSKNNLGEMPIHFIRLAKQNFHETLDALIAHGALINGTRNNGATPLALAAVKGRSKEELEYIIHRGGDLNCKDKDGDSILPYAVQCGNTEIIKYLIEKGVDIHSRNNSGEMPIHFIRSNKQNFNETLDVLIAHGALINGTRNDGATPLALAALRGRTKEELEYIVHKGGDLNCKDEDGDSILHYAVQHGSTENIKYLIEKGVDIHSRNNYGSMPIHFIRFTKQNFNETLDALIAHGALINGTQNSGATPLALSAVYGRSKEELEYIIHRGGYLHCKDEDGDSILPYAVQCGNTENIKYLIEKGVDIHSRNNSGSMPIHFIRFNKQNFNETLDVLIAHGALINGETNDGATPLALAAVNGRTKEELMYIVLRGGDLNCKGKYGMSILHYAVEDGSPENIKYLVESGLNIHLRDNSGEVPIHRIRFTTTKFEEALDTLLSLGADINSVDKYNRSTLDLAKMKKCDSRKLELIAAKGGRSSTQSLFERLTNLF